ncbi:MAG: hypothetical protein E6J37_07870 [Chloroflexi bacterium]|nr:MAG: hypothetical protein E6J37_07870 [Chloroflexota bacterium]
MIRLRPVFPTSLQDIQHSSIPAAALRRPRRNGFAKRGWIALGVALAVVFSLAGGFGVYANTLPTVVTLNVQDGEKDVRTDAQLVFRFSRPVALTTVESAMTVSPATEGTLRAVVGQTEFQWSSTTFLKELTTYTVTIDSISDLGRHPVKASQWFFTTTIQPRVLSVTVPGGVALADGDAAADQLQRPDGPGIRQRRAWHQARQAQVVGGQPKRHDTDLRHSVRPS